MVCMVMVELILKTRRPPVRSCRRSSFSTLLVEVAGCPVPSLRRVTVARIRHTTSVHRKQFGFADATIAWSFFAPRGTVKAKTRPHGVRGPGPLGQNPILASSLPASSAARLRRSKRR